MTDSNNRNENNNHETINHEKDAKCITAALAFLLLGCFFKFILIGYQTIALILWGIGVLILLSGYLPYKWMKRLVAGCTLLFVLGLCVIEIPIVSAAKGDASNDADYLIVLGAGVNGTEPSLSLHNRLAAAEIWLQEHPDSVAVLSGGQGQKEQISEAECMYRWLVQNGIEPERLYKEEQSASTQENFQYSAQILLDLNGGIMPQPVAVVSSEYHLYRAKKFAEQTGVEAVGIPAETTYPVLKLNYFIREGAAVARLWLFGY
ncbi:MAG: YdcF family protein [Peptococcaceae bacterium]|nr:YdcF family protein [Peptococcaceae bacterium]